MSSSWSVNVIYKRTEEGLRDNLIIRSTASIIPNEGFFEIDSVEYTSEQAVRYYINESWSNYLSVNICESIKLTSLVVVPGNLSQLGSTLNYLQLILSLTA